MEANLAEIPALLQDRLISKIVATWLAIQACSFEGRLFDFAWALLSDF